MSNPDEPEENTATTEETGEVSAEQGGETPAASTEPADLESLERDLLRFRDLAHRSQADLENYRKRMTREREEAVRYANGRLLEDLLPIIDSFELGLDAAEKSEEGKTIAQGFAMVQKLFADFLAKHGVEPIDAPGQEFDHNLHEAVGQEASDEVPEGVVLRQLRKGYKLRDRLLRPATVMVSGGPQSG